MNSLLRISLLRLVLGLYAFVLRIGTSINRTFAIVRKEMLHILRNRGEIKAAVIIPFGFMDDIVSGQEANVQLLVDGTSPSTANHATSHVVGFTRNMAAEVR
jgi:hypothetical protein